jgi:hypothetical protein
MVWNIGLIGNDYKILKNSINSTTYGSSGSSVFSDYFTITESGNIGINSAVPKKKLDVVGDIFNNGIIITSNVLGNVMNTSNYLQINYNDNLSASQSNILEVYGTSLFRGSVGIGTLQPKTRLDVNGNVTATQFIGLGSNITKINAANIDSGVLNVIYGGTGINSIMPNHLLFGDNNKIKQDSNLTYINNILKTGGFDGDGSKLRNIDANEITQGILVPARGGTGNHIYNIKGGLLLANLNNIDIVDRTTIIQTDDLRWNNSSNTFEVNGNIRVPAYSNLIIGEQQLNYDILGQYPLASCNIAGIIKLSANFKLNNNNELIYLNNTSSKWGRKDNSDYIYYPTETVTNSHCVGIGIEPRDNLNRLVVDGNININGVYRINGIDINEYNSNILSSRITNITLDNINKLFCGNKNRCFSLRANAANNNIEEYHIGSIDNNSATINNSFRFLERVVFDKGITLDSGQFTISTGGTDNYVNIHLLNVESENTKTLLKVNQLSSVGHTMELSNRGTLQMILRSNGNLGVGEFVAPNGSKFNPLERLHVIGNIVATGTITHSYSDERLKIFTSNIHNSLDIINNLNGYYYTPSEKAINAGFENEKQIGLSAQEVQKVLPEIVKIAPFDMSKDENGTISSASGENYLTICYERLGAVFVEAIKDLTSQIKELKEENILIKKELSNMKKIITTNYLN